MTRAHFWVRLRKVSQTRSVGRALYLDGDRVQVQMSREDAPRWLPAADLDVLSPPPGDAVGAQP